MEILFSQRHVGEMCCALRHWYVNFPRFHGFVEVANIQNFLGALASVCDETGVTVGYRAPAALRAMC